MSKNKQGNIKMLIRNLRKSFDKKKQLSDKLESREFYDLMQAYRMAYIGNQEEVVNRFEAVKEWIRQNCK